MSVIPKMHRLRSHAVQATTAASTPFSARAPLGSRNFTPSVQHPQQHAVRRSPRHARGAAQQAIRLWTRRASIVAMAAAGASSHDLLIVGPGVLGSYAGKLWRESFPDATVVAQTNSDASHDRWGTGWVDRQFEVEGTSLILAANSDAG